MSGNNSTKTNAFDVLMASARAPAAFELPRDLSAEESDTKYGLSEDDFYYMERRELYDETVRDALNEIYNAVEKEADKWNRSTYFEWPARDESEEALPIPAPADPASDAYLQSITVHFRAIQDKNDSFGMKHKLRSETEDEDNEDLRVSGFVLKYSDGSETETGLLKGSIKTVSKDLEIDEHIKRVVQHADKRGIIKILFVTTNDPGMFYFSRGKLLDECDFDFDWDYRVQEELQIPRGAILRSLDWSGRDRKLRGVLSQDTPESRSRHGRNATVPPLTDAQRELKELETETRCYFSDEIQSIHTLAHNALLDFYLQDRADTLREEFDRHNAACWNHTGARRTYHEMELLDELEYILQLNDHVEDLAVQRKRDRIIVCAKQRVAETKRQLNSHFQPKWDVLFQNNNSEHAKRILNGTARHDSLLCPPCFGSFSPAQVRSFKRCSVEGCFDSFPTCGCSVSACNRCHIALCENHRTSHEQACETSFASKCGWKQDKTCLDPDFCGKVPSAGELRQCTDCKTLCCETCRVECVGRPRQPTWKEIWLEKQPWSDIARRKRAKRKANDCCIVWCNRCFERAFCTTREWQCCDDCDLAESSSEDDLSDTDSDYMEESNESLSDDSLLSASIESMEGLDDV